jgi:hypothetical protein
VRVLDDRAFTAHLTDGFDNKINVTVMASRQAEKEAGVEVGVDPDANGEAVGPAERVSQYHVCVLVSAEPARYWENDAKIVHTVVSPRNLSMR